YFPRNGADDPKSLAGAAGHLENALVPTIIARPPITICHVNNLTRGSGVAGFLGYFRKSRHGHVSASDQHVRSTSANEQRLRKRASVQLLRPTVCLRPRYCLKRLSKTLQFSTCAIPRRRGHPPLRQRLEAAFASPAMPRRQDGVEGVTVPAGAATRRPMVLW